MMGIRFRWFILEIRLLIQTLRAFRQAHFGLLDAKLASGLEAKRGEREVNKKVKIMFFEVPNYQKLSFWEVVGMSFGGLGMSWAVLVLLGHVWGMLREPFGALGGVLEGSWSHFGYLCMVLGVSWEGLGDPSGCLRRLWGVFLNTFLTSWWIVGE